jgi:putative addiction module component (TIGR02574 family)
VQAREPTLWQSKETTWDMTEAAERLKHELGRLSIDDRAELARFLIDSLDNETDPDAEAAWDEELDRRMTEIQSGQAEGEPLDQVLAELRAKYS